MRAKNACCFLLFLDGKMAESQDPVDLRDLLQKFFALQEGRVKTYKDFDKGFRVYLRGAPNYDFATYRQMVHNITDRFNNLSQSIIEVEKNFQENGRSNIGKVIRKIQDKEKNKLELTAKLQVQEQNSVDHPDDLSTQDQVAEAKKMLQEVTESISELLEELKYEAEDILLGEI